MSATEQKSYVHLSGWCRDARSGHFPKLAANMHNICAERLANPCQKPDICQCDCHQEQT